MNQKILYLAVILTIGLVPIADAADNQKKQPQQRSVSNSVSQKNLPKEDKEKNQTRSITSAVVGGGMVFSSTAFAGNNNFFLGGDSTGGGGKEPFALSRAQGKRVDGKWEVEVKELAPDAGVQVNNEGGLASPLNGKNVTITTIGIDNHPVVTTDESPFVYLVDKPEDGTLVLRNASVDNMTDFELGTSDGAEDAKKVHAIAATKITVKHNVGGDEDPFIFAATSFNNVDFSTNNANATHTSIVPIAVFNDRLRPFAASDFTDIEASNAGLGLNVGTAASDAPNPLGSGPLAIANAATLQAGATIDLWWDDTLEKLYGGLYNFKSAGVAGDGVVGLLLGGIDATGVGALKGVSVIGTDANGGANDPGTGVLALTQGDKGYVIAGIQAGANNAVVGIKKVRTMHTSSGKDYVIVNGGVSNVIDDATLNTWVFALPVMPFGNANAGKLADITTDPAVYQLPTDQGQLVNVNRANLGAFNADELKAVVGADPRYISANTSQPITDMRIIGDTVYVSVAGARDVNHNEEAGIFASSALFNQDGNISRWTPWQRVDGSAGSGNVTDGNVVLGKVAGFGLDERSNKFWYLEGVDKKKVNVTLWDAGDKRANGDGGIHNEVPLSTALNPTFVANNAGGVFNLVSFDGETPGFAKPVNKYDAFNMMVATGDKRVALIESGRLKARDNAADVFETTEKFEDATTVFPSVGVASGQVLYDIGAITSAEVSRFAIGGGNVKGWLFAGGEGGLAVLAKADGSGWPNNTGLAKLDAGAYPVTDFGWRKLELASGPIKNIRKIIADSASGKLYVLTRDALHRITMEQADIAGGVVDGGRVLTVIDLSKGEVGGANFPDSGDPATFANKIPVGTSVADENNYKGDERAFFFEKDFDQFFDMVLVQDERGGANTTTIALATTRGVIVSNAFKDAFTAPAAGDNNPFFKLPAKAAGGDLELGPSLKFEFVLSKRGGNPVVNGNVKNADGNLYVTALNEDEKGSFVAVYRFDVTGGQVKAIVEPYKDNSDPAKVVDYFYKIADVPPHYVPFLYASGPRDFVATTEQFGNNNSDFVSSIPQTPDPNLFLKAGQKNSAIDLQGTIRSPRELAGTAVRDSASGAVYIPGEFGVLVNE